MERAHAQLLSRIMAEALFRSAGLEEAEYAPYAAKASDGGYDAATIKTMAIDELVEELGMKKGHARKLHLHLAGASAGAGSGTVGEKRKADAVGSSNQTAPTAGAKKEKGGVMTISVLQNQSRQALQFRIRETARLGKVFDAVAAEVGVAHNTFRLFFDGIRLNREQTAAEAGLEDGDQIDMMIEQQGGGRCCR